MTKSFEQMNDKDILDKFYNTETGFVSPYKLIEKLKIKDPKMKQYIIQLINNQTSYQLMKTPKKQKIYPPLQASYPFQRVQIDLLDLGSVYNKIPTQKNNGFRYVFGCIDTFTRQAFVEPLKTKTIKEILPAFIGIMKKIKNVPDRIDCDKESAFNSKEFRKLCDDYGIRINFVDDLNGVGIIERFFRTLRRMVVLFMTHRGEKRWIDAIEKLIINYNKTPHSFLENMSPLEAEKNERKVQEIFKQKTNQNKKYMFIYNVGDKVRTKIRKSKFDKKTDVNFSKTIHTVEKIDGNNIYVSGRKMPYKGDELLKVNNEENDKNEDEEDEEDGEDGEDGEDEDEDEDEDRKYSKERQVSLRLKRVGVDRQNIVSEKRMRKQKVRDD